MVKNNFFVVFLTLLFSISLIDSKKPNIDLNHIAEKAGFTKENFFESAANGAKFCTENIDKQPVSYTYEENCESAKNCFEFIKDNLQKLRDFGNYLSGLDFFNNSCLKPIFNLFKKEDKSQVAEPPKQLPGEPPGNFGNFQKNTLTYYVDEQKCYWVFEERSNCWHIKSTLDGSPIRYVAVDGTTLWDAYVIK